MTGAAMKRVIWAIVGLALAFSLIFYQALLSVIASWFLHAYSAANWASPLQYDRLFISGNQLVIVNPRMERSEFFSASQIRATLGLNLIERSLEVDVDIHSPHWDFQTDRLIFSENFEKLLGSEEKWFKINPRIHLKSGSLAWIEEANSTPRSLEFDLEFKPQDGGSIEVNFSRGILSLNSSKNADAMEVNCRCQTIDCSSLLATLRFFGVDCPQWEVPSGQIEGEIKAIFPKKLRPYFEGELYVENLAFQWGEKELEGKIGLSRILLEKNEAVSKSLGSALADNARSPSDKLERPFFATIGRLDILQPASLRCLSFCHPWEVKEIVGSIQLDQTDAAKIDLESILESYRWRLQGNANINAHRALI